MTDYAQRMTEAEREQRWKNQRPRDASTVILLDRRESEPRVLLGRRHDRHVFLPGKYVFPGGRVDRGDGRVRAAAELDPRVQARLVNRMKQGQSLHRARALALAAVREVFEETGIAIGRPVPGIRSRARDWGAFYNLGLAPDLSGLRFIARAITPPRRPRRFDTRFFALDLTGHGQSTEALMRPSEELDKLVWVPMSDATGLDLPTITTVVLEELTERLKQDPDLQADLPVPFYHSINNKWRRDLL